MAGPINGMTVSNRCQTVVLLKNSIIDRSEVNNKECLYTVKENRDYLLGPFHKRLWYPCLTII